ncbi:chitinase [Parablautia intestinalis]|jgi:spore germination protein YaaH|uniref:Chitinase n=1 Tax=Parablautia intestinalis TaxID=2320100 RepID=A0A3A9AW07_9FIRM|nr:glycosyl hydrolase family 18 protein [Parablautia intestinalis]MCI8614885.1 chitinase [Lachnospiraceae bacterium]MDE7046458.1 chitinase [Lachnospiraceae bacterium]RKI90525.1 chitinase [Parablautia intestinalis]
MKKKIVPVLIAIVLIIVIAGISIGAKLLERYSYSKERADLNAYFDMRGDADVAIVLQDEIIEERAALFDGIYYLDLNTVHTYFNDRFYEDKGEGLLLYTVPDDIIRTVIGSSEVADQNGTEALSYVPARYEGETLYVALDYVKRYTNFSYEGFTEPERVQIYTTWEERQVADVKKNTAVRVLGGVKSEILADVQKGDALIILEQMETWSKVKTRNAIIGYVENKRLEEARSETPIAVTDYEEPEYTSVTRDYKINLGWHVVASVAGNDTLDEVTAQAKGLNVISPTWFMLSDNEGNFTSFASKDYVDRAHNKGLEVWGLVENIAYKDSIDMYEILSSTTKRAKLIDGLMDMVFTYGLDGINVDFEQISTDCGEHYIQFIRELSIPCRANGIVLSVDNYVPRGYNDHYDRQEQGVVADYVIIMGYDEHYAGSPEAGSVASIDFVEEGIARTVEQVPSNKVINAVPFYTRIWETKDGTLSSQAVGMDMAEEYVRAHSIQTEWSEETCQNYGEYTDGGSLYQVWLEDERSIEVKLNIMDKYAIGGVASWRLGYEKAEIWDVIGAYLSR